MFYRVSASLSSTGKTSKICGTRSGDGRYSQHQHTEITETRLPNIFTFIVQLCRTSFWHLTKTKPNIWSTRRSARLWTQQVKFIHSSVPGTIRPQVTFSSVTNQQGEPNYSFLVSTSSLFESSTLPDCRLSCTVDSSIWRKQNPRTEAQAVHLPCLMLQESEWTIWLCSLLD